MKKTIRVVSLVGMVGILAVGLKIREKVDEALDEMDIVLHRWEPKKMPRIVMGRSGVDSVISGVSFYNVKLEIDRSSMNSVTISNCYLEGTSEYVLTPPSFIECK